MFGCYSKKLHRLLPARDSLEASVPSFGLMVLAPGESWGSSLEQNCLPGKGVVCLNIPLGRTQQDEEQVTSTTVLHCHHCHAARSPAFPCHLGRHALGCALGSLQCPCSHHCVNTSGTGLNQRKLLCAPLPGIPAKTCSAQPPSRRTQTHGPTSCQAYREEVPEQLM